MKLIIFTACLAIVGCASTPKTPAIVFDHENKELRKQFNNLSADEVASKVGIPLFRGFDSLEGQGPDSMYRLVYVQANQESKNVEDIMKAISKNKETGVKCMSFNFSKSFKYKFKSNIAPLSWDQDCLNFKNVKDEVLVSAQ